MKHKKYQIVDYPNKGLNYGEYKGVYPGQAAKKIFSKLATEQNFTNSSSQKGIVFSIRDIDMKKEMTYIGTRIQYVKPIVVNFKNGKSITYRYKNIVARYYDSK